MDVDFVRKAVRAIGRCAIKVETSAERCVSTLLDLIQTKVGVLHVLHEDTTPVWCGVFLCKHTHAHIQIYMQDWGFAKPRAPAGLQGHSVSSYVPCLFFAR